MTVPQIDPYPEAPGPSDPGEIFDEKAFAFTQSQEPRRQQMNQVAQFVNDTVTQFAQDVDQAVDDATQTAVSARDTAVASANTATQAASDAESDRTAAQEARDAALAVVGFAGKWADLAGALNTPATVFHQGAYWRLLNDLADVTASEPANDNADWLFVYSNAELRRKLLDEATLYADFVNGDYRLYEGVGAGVVRGKLFSDLFNFTRSSDATGQGVSTLETVTADVARFVYSPELKKRQGLLIEEQRTNLLLWSEDLTQWSSTSEVAITSGITSPNGDSTAFRLEADNGLYRLVENQLQPLQESTLYQYSLWIRGVNTNEVRLYLGGTATAGIPITGDWQRLIVPITTQTAGLTSAQIRLVALGDIVEVWKPQVELGSFPASHIPTEGTQLTRLADDCFVPQQTMQNMFRLDEFTIFCEGGPESLDAESYIFSFSGIGWRNVGGAPRLYYRPEVTVEDVAFQLPVSRNMRFAAALDGNEVRGAVDGSFASRNVTTFPQSYGNLNVGRLSSVSNRIIEKRLMVIPRALSEAELIALTQPEAE